MKDERLVKRVMATANGRMCSILWKASKTLVRHHSCMLPETSDAGNWHTSCAN